MRRFTKIRCSLMSLPQLHPKCVRTAPLLQLFYNMRLKPTDLTGLFLVLAQASGAAPALRMRSSDCTRSSSEGSRRRPCCRLQTPLPCCSGRCLPLVRSTCARLMAGRRSPQSPSISLLTSQPETIPSCYRRSRHTEFQPHSGRHPARNLNDCLTSSGAFIALNAPRPSLAPISPARFQTQKLIGIPGHPENARARTGTGDL